MITHEFDTKNKILFIRFQDIIREEDLLSAFALYEDERFSPEYHVMYDSRGSELQFSEDAFQTVETLFGRNNRRGAGTRTAFVLDTHLKNAITRVARGVREDWGTYWKFFADPHTALTWLMAEDVGDFDFGPTLQGR